eukprot:CAMPEP_0116870990 /NCGR_PEP_ID=MMETSP0463-20121206/1144_1 /TAXON_ID=181622 /ORGANISM="Strombidinopsis sp, Strain SopsisLIS2011" /LENGTH=120 /DNA_ID=CAMNT_0004508571 /DNA_START=2330 /DNA_END=2692 /DNA_ORIENTATION=-
MICAFADYIINLQLWDLLLEAEYLLYLDFEINKEIMFRHFIGDQLFKQLVYKVVEMNEMNEGAASDVNVTLLDKIKEYQRVMKMLISIARKRVDAGKPMDFTTSAIGEDLRRVVAVDKNR